MNEEEKPTFASSFSGIGGPDLGFERAGFRVIRHCEYDQFKSQVLKKHWPDADHWDDIAELSRHATILRHIGRRKNGRTGISNDQGRRTQSERQRNPGGGNKPATGGQILKGDGSSKPWRGNTDPSNPLKRADVEWGSPPCQDLSIAGKRRGLAGAKSGLFYQWEDYIEANSPRHFAVMEQVPGLFSSNRGGDFASVLGAITGWQPPIPGEGWGNSGVCRGPKRTVCWRTLDARYFGVAQRRRRVFLAAGFGEVDPTEVLWEPAILPWNFTPISQKGDNVCGTITRRSSDSGGDPTCQQLVVGTLAASGAGTSRAAGQGNEADFCIVAPTPQGRDAGSDSGGNPSMGAICEEIDANGNSDAPRISKGMVRPPDTRIYHATGDAVCVKVAEWIGRQCFKAIRG